MTLLITDNLLCPLARHGLELSFLEALHSTGIPEERGSGGVMREKIQSVREQDASTLGEAALEMIWRAVGGNGGNLIGCLCF